MSNEQVEKGVEDYDVVICGGGPTGLMMGLSLAGHTSVRVLLLDKEVDRSFNTRTVAIWPRNIESIYLYSADLYKRFVEKATSVTQVTLAFGSQHLLQVPLGSMTCNSKVATVPWYLFQREAEQLLEDYAVEKTQASFAIWKGWCLEEAAYIEEEGEQGPNVSLSVKEVKSETTRQIRTRYLIGCDGPGSKVRSVAKIELDLLPKQSAGWIADGKLSVTRRGPGPEIMAKGVAGNAFFISTSTGITGFFSLTDELTRVVLPVPMESIDSEERSNPTVHQFNDKLATLNTHYLFQVSDVVSINAYRFRFGLAKTFHDDLGRVFLAGDSAHFHSPVGGQGMNLGLQDAINLSWKLRMCIRYPEVVIADKLLRSYDAERRPLAHGVVKRTYTSTSYFFLRHFHFAWWLWAQLVWLMYKFALPRGLTIMSQLGANYSKSPLCKNNWRRSRWYYLWDRSGVGAGYHMPFTDVKLQPDQRTFLACLCDREGFNILYFPHLSRTRVGPTSTSALLEQERVDDEWLSLREYLQSHRLSVLISKVLIISSHEATPPDDYADLSIGGNRTIKFQRIHDIDSRQHFVGDSTESCLYVIRPDYFVGFRSRPFRFQPLLDWFGTFAITKL